MAGSLRLDLSQFYEIAAFAQFGSDLDKSTQKQLERGKRLTELLKQDQYSPLRISQQIIIFYTAINGYLDNVPVDKVRDFEKELYSIIQMEYSDVLTTLETEKVLSDDVKARLKQQLRSVLHYLQCRVIHYGNEYKRH